MTASNIIFQGQNLWWLWLLLAAAAAAGVVWLYRYERRLVAARVGNLLLGLRLAAVAILFVALLQPVIAVVQESADLPRILVAIDVSQSMQVADPQASDLEKLRWARALGTIGDSAVDVLSDAQQAPQERGQPSSPPQRADKDAAAQREQPRRDDLRRVLIEIGNLPRREIVERLLTATGNPLLSELQKRADLRIVLFANTAVEVDAASLVLSDTVAQSFGLDDSATNIQASISTDRSATSRDKPSAILLFTDGRDTTSRDPAAASSTAARDTAPIFPVMIGSPRSPVDIAIADWDVSPSVFLGDTPRFHITLATSGFEGRNVEVVLQPAGGPALRKTVPIDTATTNVSFDWPATTAGRHSFTISAASQPEELRDDNNSAEFAVTVVDDTIRVLLIEEEARWEFRFIDNAYRRDSRVDVSQVVFEQPFLDVLEAPFFARRLDWPEDPAAWDQTALAETDLVIVGDVAPTSLTPQVWETLERYVDAGRGTLVLLAGKRDLLTGSVPTTLANLLPVSDLSVVEIHGEAAKGPPPLRGFHLQLTPEGEREPMLQFAADVITNREIWQGFPGHAWGMTGMAKPGASVLATIVPPAGQQQPAAEKRAVIARQPYGLGQVLWLGIDSTWRWRHRAGDKYHHRFWGQLARWAARHRSQGGSDDIKFGFERSDIAQGEPAVLRARFSRVFLERFPQIRVSAEIETTDTAHANQSIRLHPAPGRPLAFEGRAANLPSGEYRASLKVEGADLEGAPLTSTLFVAPPTSRELSNFSANAELLQQLAKVSGGRMVSPDELVELPAQLVADHNSQDGLTEVALWRHPLLLILFCAFVTAEWAIRKWNGLP